MPDIYNINQLKTNIMITKYYYTTRINKHTNEIEIYANDGIDLWVWAQYEGHSNTDMEWYKCATLPIPKERENEALKLWEFYNNKYPRFRRSEKHIYSKKLLKPVRK